MREVWLYVLLGLLVLLGGGYLLGMSGMKATLALQIKDVDLARIADGAYQGSYKEGRFVASVEVTVKDHRIASVKPLGNLDKAVSKSIYNPLVDRILQTQTPRVDAVSGATATTKAIEKAVENALTGASGK